MTEAYCGLEIAPCAPEYGAARRVHNRAIEKFPARIAYCTNEEEVARAIRAAREAGVKARVRSGGHSYEGFCVGDCAAVIDVGCMDSISIDESAGTLTIGPGARNRALYESAGALGYPFPSGTCPTVAAAGLTLGGGWGLSARMFGLTCDSLLSATLVDACGRRHVANAECDEELFFALRGGGGGNFGVVTSLAYRLPPKRFDVTYVELSTSDAGEAEAAEFILLVQAWLGEGDRRFTPLARVTHTPLEPRGLSLRGIYYGGEAQARASLSSFLSLGLAGRFDEMTFLEAIRIVEDGYPPEDRFTAGGSFALSPFSIKEALCLARLVAAPAPGSVGATVSLYGLGGAVDETGPFDTAYFYRGARNIAALTTSWEDPAAKRANLAWFAPRYRALREMTCGAYVNFPNLENRDFMRAYYGGNAERLRRVKARLDPENFFCFPQSVR